MRMNFNYGGCNDCNNIFESVDNDHKKCFKQFYKMNPDAVNYTIEFAPKTRIIRDRGGNIIYQESHAHIRQQYLFDYLIDKDVPRFLNPLIKRGCDRESTIGDLFGHLFIDSYTHHECDDHRIFKHVKHMSNAIITALRNGWYTPRNNVDFYNEDDLYILKVTSYKWMFKYSNEDKYETIICELLNCGEIIFEKDREKIKKYLYREHPKFFHYDHNEYIERLVTELYEIYDKHTSILEIKEPSEG